MRKIFGLILILVLVFIVIPAEVGIQRCTIWAAETSGSIVIPLSGIRHDVEQLKTAAVILYDTATWQVIKMFNGSNAVFLRDGRILKVEDDKANKTTLYDTTTLQVIKTLDGSRYADFDKDGKILFVSDYVARKTTLYDTATWQVIMTFDESFDAFFDKDGKVLEVKDDKAKKVTLYDTATRQIIKTFDGTDAYFYKEGTILRVENFYKDKITLYNTATWQVIKTFDGRYAYFLRDGRILSVNDYNANKLTLYDAATWEIIKTFNGSNADFDKDGRILKVDDYKVRGTTLYDTATWQVIKTFYGSYSDFYKDGKILKVNDYGANKTTLYDTATWQVIKTFDGSNAYFDKDDRILKVGNDKTKKVTLYETATWQVIKTFDTLWAESSGSMVALKLEGINLISLFVKGEFETTKEYEKRVRSLEMPYAFNVKVAGYDADRGGFEGEMKGTKVFIPVPREKAKEIINRKDRVRIEGKLKYYDPQNVQLIDAGLIDEATNDKYAVLKTSEGTTVAYVPPKPATIYTPKPTLQEIPAENIRDIPDFKSSPRNNDLAVIIGIENYRGLPKSDYSKSDAGIVKEYLKALGFQERNVTFLTDDNASLSDIKKTLETWLHNKAKKESKVFIYYSGHGAPNAKTGDAYIVPFDGDPNYLEDTGYSLKRLYDSLGKLQAKEIIVALDSCFSGAGGRSVLAKGARPLVMMTTSTVLPSNMAVLSATQGSQISTSSPEKGHGVFTYYFLKALKDGKKTIAEIYEYIKPLVEDEAKQLNVQQSPSVSPDIEKLKGRFGLRK